MLLKKTNNFQRSISLASEMKDFLSQIHTNSHSESSLLWFELPHQHNYKRFWARMGTFKPRQASKLLHPFYFQQAEPVGAQLIFPKMLRAAHAVAGKRLLLPIPCTWNRQQHLRSKQTRRASRNGRLLPRCLCKKMERTCLYAFTGRSLTIQWYILKNKSFSQHLISVYQRLADGDLTFILWQTFAIFFKKQKEFCEHITETWEAESSGWFSCPLPA